MTRARRRFAFYAVIVVSVFVADQIIKRIVDRLFMLHESHEIIPGMLNLTHTRNWGAAFGLFSDRTLPAQTVILTLVSMAALVAIFLYFIRLPAGRVLPHAGLSLVLGGALGNLADRIRVGYVTDFVDVYWREYHWPTFNVADSAITIGVGLLLIDMLRDRTPRTTESGAVNPRVAAERME
ncbi:MAG: signal peptidase II [Vicinamibacteria bacterium]|nr:signal peptidase II [Vicinamibacteria bacterium]